MILKTILYSFHFLDLHHVLYLFSLKCELVTSLFVVIVDRDIIRGSPGVNWESIKGLENAKRLLKEAVVMPIKYPK